MCLWACFCQNWRLLFHNGQWNLANQTLRGTIQLCRIWQGIAILSDKYYKDVFLQFGQFNNALMFFVIERIIYYLSEKNNIYTQIESNTCSDRLYLLFVGGLMSHLRYLCLFVYSGVQQILCCVFFFFFRLVYHMLSVSLDYPFWYSLTFI